MRVMNINKQTADDLTAVARQVMSDSGMPNLPDLVEEFSHVEKRRDGLIRQIHATTRLMEMPINEMQYQLLMDYVLLEAAKKNMDSDFLFMEMCVKYNIDAPQDLKIRDFWEALGYIRAYEA